MVSKVLRDRQGTGGFVLILVVVEYGLEEWVFVSEQRVQPVLILVVVEYGLEANVKTNWYENIQS